LCFFGVLLEQTRRSVGSFAAAVLTRDRRAIRTLIVTAVPLAFIATGAVAQAIPLHRIDAGIGHTRLNSTGVVPLIGIALVTAARGRSRRR
jgi:hypothetical protein